MSYKTLLKIGRESAVLAGIIQLLEWDQETYMPQGAAPMRAEQLESLAGLVHKIKTGKPFRTALEKLIDLESGEVIASDLPPEQQAALREWRRDYLKATKLPSNFVKAFTKLTSEAHPIWRDARQNNNFAHFCPTLEKIVMLCREKADYLGYKEHPYDALLDIYEPTATRQQLLTLFNQLRPEIVALLKNIVVNGHVNTNIFQGTFAQDKQMALSHLILKAMGHDETCSRLDLSSHPFSSASHPTDSRITSRIHADSPIPHLLAVLHEAGHSLYEMGLPQEEYGSPLCEPLSISMHESQSRWWETRIGQSKPFWNHFLPLLKQSFPGQLDDVGLNAFYKVLNHVKPSLIRTEADEVTYPLHIIIRFELEYQLIEGSLKVKELPEAWNSKMQEYLGITPTTDSEGCLQDIHWSTGLFGYFPSYTLGNIYAAHLFEQFEKDHTDWQTQVSCGNLLFIKEWLGTHVHQHGRRYTSQELLSKVTGKPLSSDAYITYLNTKYSG